MPNHIHTVYHLMEQRGAFASNPANPDSRGPNGEALYQGPVQYPKMLYHPEGKERVLTPAEIIVTPLGPKAVGEQKEIIWQIVNGPEEEQKLVGLGWHRHAAAAIAASGKEAPSTGMDQTIAGLEAQIAEMKAKMEALQAMQPGVKPLVEQVKEHPLAKPLASAKP